MENFQFKHKEEHDGFKFYVIEDNVHHLIAKNVVITEDHIQANHDLHLKYKTQDQVWLILESDKIQWVKREAFLFLNEHNSKLFVGGVAILRSVISLVAFKFYISVIKQKFPIYQGKDLEDALSIIGEKKMQKFLA